MRGSQDMTTEREEQSIYYGMLDVTPHSNLYQSMKDRGLIAENARFSPLSVVVDRVFSLFSTSFHPWKASFGQVWKKGVGGFYPRDSYPVWIGAVSYGSRSWRTWESYIGLAGCGMTVKMGAGCGMTEISMARYRTKIILQERDLLKLTAGMRDSFKIVVRMRDETKENHGGL